ncbi:hypothetical protein K3495_g9380 [Podosphaera aphanis]|nr:hypothetical protein K3495_g9380 [Podosphaera aphanis]
MFRTNPIALSLPLPRTLTTSFRCYSDNSSKSPSVLKYVVRRTPSDKLPVYQLSKNGGNKKITKIRKVEGDIAALRDEIREAFGLTDRECTINQLTGHILVKGHRRQQIFKFLEERNF